MKKQFIALALCLSIVMTHSAYSMDSETEKDTRHATPMTKKLDEKDLSASHASTHYRWSDLNPYNWSAATKVTAAQGLVLFTLAGWAIYGLTDMLMTPRPKRCNPEMSYNIGCDDKTAIPGV